MFTARYVPKVYLFGTFSAQNAEEIAGQFRLAAAARLGPTTLASGATTRRKGLGGGIMANPQPASRLRGGRTPRNGFRAAKSPKQFHQD
jgi:hypothetical protein